MYVTRLLTHPTQPTTGANGTDFNNLFTKTVDIIQTKVSRGHHQLEVTTR